MRPRVLVADDDPSTRALIDLALQEAGYDCVLAADGKAALEQARATRPDLVVLDVAMPFLSGDDVQRELRRDRRSRYIPVVFVTAKRTTAEMTARFRNGADDFVAKPFDVDELVARIASALRRAAELRSLNPLSGLPGNLSIAHEIDALMRMLRRYLRLDCVPGNMFLRRYYEDAGFVARGEIDAVYPGLAGEMPASIFASICASLTRS